MALLLKPLELEQIQPNRRLPDLGIRLSRARAASGLRLTLIHPGRAGERDHRRYVGLLRVRAGDGNTARGHAQIVATGNRVLGLFMAGDLAGRPISEADGAVVAFSVDRSELAGPRIERRGAAGGMRAVFRGRAGDPCLLEIEAIVARLTDDGAGAGADLSDFLLDMTLSGVAALQRLATEVAVSLR